MINDVNYILSDKDYKNGKQNFVWEKTTWYSYFELINLTHQIKKFFQYQSSEIMSLKILGLNDLVFNFIWIFNLSLHFKLTCDQTHFLAQLTIHQQQVQHLIFLILI